jgi:hypothetical protein
MNVSFFKSSESIVKKRKKVAALVEKKINQQLLSPSFSNNLQNSNGDLPKEKDQKDNITPPVILNQPIKNKFGYVDTDLLAIGENANQIYPIELSSYWYLLRY